MTAVLRTAEPRGGLDLEQRPPKSLGQLFAPDVVTVSAPLGSAAESIRVLRTHVMAQHVQLGRRALAVCAASVDVGCTFVAANLAVALAQSQLNVLLIDADLRAPGVPNLIRPVQSLKGLAGCLRAPASAISDFIDEDVFPNLSVLHAGERMDDAQELLAREWFRDVVEYCLRAYDVTIVDTPPANTSSDARRISTIVGHCLIVAQRNRSLISDVKTLAEQMLDDQVKIVGTVMKAD